jgi:hypothetical protein
MCNIVNFLSAFLFFVVKVAVLLSKAVFFPLAIIFFTFFKVLRIIWHVIRWPSPRYRRAYRIRKFAEAQERVLRSAQGRRERLSCRSAKRNISELGQIAVRELRSRKRDIAPAVFDTTRGSIQRCVADLDIGRLSTYYSIITESDESSLNQRLITVDGGQ